LALELAKHTGYALLDPGGGVPSGYQGRPAGRALDATALHATGVAGLVLSEVPADDAVTIDELVGYMAGPAVPIFQYAGLNADVHLRSPLAVAEWELVTPSAQELRSLLPVPSLSRYQPSSPWSPDDWAGLAFLRRKQPAARPITGLAISFPRAHPEWALWRPLLVLSLCTNDVIRMWSDHIVEAGRHVHTRFDQVVWNISDQHGMEVEIPWPTAMAVTPDQEEPFRRRVTELSKLLPGEQPSNSQDRHYRNLRLAAEHLLAAGQYATHGQATPLHTEQEPEALLHYVIVLEALLSEDDREVSRKVAQRTAVLAGGTDDDRLTVYTLAKDAYTARSQYAHGVQPKRAARVDLERLRDVVCRVILSRLILGHTPQPGKTLVQLCDEALLSGRVRGRRLRTPITAFSAKARP
jgi:hypothetical protein